MNERIEELQRRIAWLESRLDQTESELSHLNELLLDCGFPEGIHTLKATIEELLEEANRPYPRPPEDYPPQTFDFWS
jgi:DNA repair exonuclease SbcCD ATPase subunit